jgi:RecB family exonuclease
MPRFLITEPFPTRPTEIEPDVLIVAPNARIGRALGVSARSLQNHAKEILKKNGFGIATPIKAAETLRKAVRIVLPNADASSVARHYREILGAALRSDIDLDRLANVDSERPRTLARIAIRYVDMLDKMHLVDSDAVLSTVLRRGLIKPQKILVYGYFRARQLSARPEEIEFIDRFAGDGSVFYLPCGEDALFAANREWNSLLESRGWQQVSPTSEPSLFPFNSETEFVAATFARAGAEELKSGAIEAIEYPDLNAEVRGTLAAAKAAAIEKVPLSNIAIVCRDLDLYAPLLVSTAREYGLPIELEHSVPIGNTAFGDFVSLIFEVVEAADDENAEDADDVSDRKNKQGFLYESTLRLMLHRFGPGLTDEQRATAYQTRPSGFEKWLAITDEASILRAGEACSAAEWTTWLRGLLGRWELRREDKLGGTAADIEAYNNFFDSLDEVSRERKDQAISFARFAHDVSDVLANVKTPLRTESGGIRILLPNMVVGCEFKRVFVIGMAEGILPAPATDSNVIDFCEREKLRQHGIHFEDAQEVPRWEALTFYFTLLSCTGKVSLSYPKFVGETELLESSYFKRLGIEPGASTESLVSSIPEYRQSYLRDGTRNHDAVLAAARHQYAVEAYRESGGPPDKYDGVIGVPVSKPYWSASSLSRIGSCAFKWFANDVLRLNEREEADAELQGDMRGRLYHKALELAVKRTRESVDLRTAVLAVLEEEFGNAEVLEADLGHVANWKLRRGEHLDTLRFAVSSDQFVHSGASVIDTERSFEAEYCGLKIKGKIDRVDRLKNGELLAIDYKSGSYVAKIKDDEGFLRIEIQLPIYSRIGAAKLYPGETCKGGAIFHIADAKRTIGKDVDLDRVLRRIKKLLDDGNFAVDPDVKQEACKFCEYDVVCRRGTRLMRKRAAAK